MSSRYEHASLILTSNLPFSGWGGVFGDQAVAAAMIDRIVHHADVLTLKGASYRLRNRGIDTLPSIRTTADEPRQLASPNNYTAHFSTGTTAQFSSVIDSARVENTRSWMHSRFRDSQNDSATALSQHSGPPDGGPALMGEAEVEVVVRRVLTRLNRSKQHRPVAVSVGVHRVPRRASSSRGPSWSPIERGDGFDLVGGPARQVGALREVLAREAVGVLVRGSLPWAVGVGEVDGDVGLCCAGAAAVHPMHIRPWRCRRWRRLRRDHPWPAWAVERFFASPSSDFCSLDAVDGSGHEDLLDGAARDADESADLHEADATLEDEPGDESL